MKFEFGRYEIYISFDCWLRWFPKTLNTKKKNIARRQPKNCTKVQKFKAWPKCEKNQ